MNNILETITNKSIDQYKIIEAKFDYLIDYLFYTICKQGCGITEEDFKMICYTLNINPEDKTPGEKNETN